LEGYLYPAAPGLELHIKYGEIIRFILLFWLPK
jgi:hypothetical protein